MPKRDKRAILSKSLDEALSRPDPSVHRMLSRLRGGRPPGDAVAGNAPTKNDVVAGHHAPPVLVPVGGRPPDKRRGDRHAHPKETFRLDAAANKRIKVFCAERGLTKQDFWSGLIAEFLQFLDDGKPCGFASLVAGHQAHDMTINHETHDDVVKSYREYSGNAAWTADDDRAGRRFNEADHRLVEIAMILTIEKKLRGSTKGQPVGSFRYFVPELNEMLQRSEAGELPAGIGEYHRYVKGAWRQRIKNLRDKLWRKSHATTENAQGGGKPSP